MATRLRLMVDSTRPPRRSGSAKKNDDLLVFVIASSTPSPRAQKMLTALRFGRLYAAAGRPRPRVSCSSLCAACTQSLLLTAVGAGVRRRRAASIGFFLVPGRRRPRDKGRSKGVSTIFCAPPSTLSTRSIALCGGSLDQAHKIPSLMRVLLSLACLAVARAQAFFGNCTVITVAGAPPSTGGATGNDVRTQLCLSPPPYLQARLTPSRRASRRTARAPARASTRPQASI